MRRTISFILFIVIVLNLSFCLSEATAIDFDPFLANAVKLTVDEWLTDSKSRALLSTLLEFSIAANDVEGTYEMMYDMLYKPSYVGRSSSVEDTLTIIGRANNSFVIIYYYPSEGWAHYYVLGGQTNVSLEKVAWNLCGSEYFRNDESDMLECIASIQESFSKEPSIEPPFINAPATNSPNPLTEDECKELAKEYVRNNISSSATFDLIDCTVDGTTCLVAIQYTAFFSTKTIGILIDMENGSILYIK